MCRPICEQITPQNNRQKYMNMFTFCHSDQVLLLDMTMEIDPNPLENVQLGRGERTQYKCYV